MHNSIGTVFIRHLKLSWAGEKCSDHFHGYAEPLIKQMGKYGRVLVEFYSLHTIIIDFDNYIDRLNAECDNKAQ